MSEVLGIDLGSLSARVAYSSNGVIKKLSNEQKNIWPCTVSIFDKKISFGSQGTNLENTIIDHLEFLGRTEDYINFRKDCNNEIIVNDKKILKYKLNFKEFFPEQITALILTNIMNSLNVNTKSCVLTVPINFDPARRQALFNAANIAGLEVLRLINKPTAAAIGFYFEKYSPQKPKSNILIYHIGVTHCDVTIVELCDKKIEVKYSESSECISKNLIDKLFFDYILKKYKINIKDPIKQQMLRNKIEKAKIELSSVCDSELEIDFDRYELLLREDLNAAIENIINNDLIMKALKNCKLMYSDINDVLLLGMSTKIIKVTETLSNLFNRVNIIEFFKVEDLASKGAAILGAYLSNGDFLKNVKIVDLNFPVIQTENRVLFNSQIKVPSRNFYEEANQDVIKIYNDNILIQKYKLLDILPRASLRLDFTLSINGTLCIKAIDDIRDKVVQIRDISRIDEALLGDLQKLNVKLYEESRTSSSNETLIDLQKIIRDNINKVKNLGIDVMYKDIFMNMKHDVEEWKNKPALNKKMILSKINAVETYLQYIFNL